MPVIHVSIVAVVEAEFSTSPVLERSGLVVFANYEWRELSRAICIRCEEIRESILLSFDARVLPVRESTIGRHAAKLNKFHQTQTIFNVKKNSRIEERCLICVENVPRFVTLLSDKLLNP
jgi:hypothetical protein